MFFDNLENLPVLAGKSGFTIFVIPSQAIDSLNPGKKRIKTASNSAAFDFPPATLYFSPERDAIRVDQIRELESFLGNRETSPRFFVVKHAETMNEQAQNAALKLLEEPKENCYLVFLATELDRFLPTVLSRSTTFVFKTENPLDAPPAVPPETLENAKNLLAASPRAALNLINLWTNKASKKDRSEILQILSTTVEIAYKSYFKTGNRSFLEKIPRLLTAYENIKANGHIRLQLIAHLC